MNLHQFIDFEYGPQGDQTLVKAIEDFDLESTFGPDKENLLHVATRRRRLKACQILLDAGADINAKTKGDKTAFAHAIRRGFQEIVEELQSRGCDQSLTLADELAVLMSQQKWEDAQKLIGKHPETVHTGNPEEDRLLADVAGRQNGRIDFLIEAGAPLTCPGLDGGTPLHITAWFGQLPNTKLLIEKGAPLEIFDPVHQSSPLGWAVHGSQFSGGAEEVEDTYVAIVEALLAAGSKRTFPDQPTSLSYYNRLMQDASPKVRQVLKNHKPNV